MLRVEILSDDELDIGSYKKILQFLVYCYKKPELPSEKNKKYFAQTTKHFILRDDGKIVSYLRVTMREVFFNGSSLKIGGIGDVATHPLLRGKGNATNLIKQALKILRKENQDIILIFTDVSKMGSFYQRLGFTPIRTKISFRDKYANVKTIGKRGAMIISGINKKKFKIVQTKKSPIHLGDGGW